MVERFSRRHGHTSPDPEIAVREDAPTELRSVLVDIAYESGFSPKPLRKLVCRVLRVAPDPGNWSEYPNIDEEVRNELAICDWFHVYDVIEEIYAAPQISDAERFAQETNDYFRKRGIGWQLIDGRIEVRGPEHFEVTVRSAVEALEEIGLETAHGELREAQIDLSRRPEADVTGAIQHAMAALECVARDMTGNSGATLGKIISDYPALLPKPLDKAVEKAWGYASDRGRHLREGGSPAYEDAELIVGISGAVCSYLIRKNESLQENEGRNSTSW